MPVYGAIEAGGTKFICLVGTSPDDLRVEGRFPTTTPSKTLAQVRHFFHAYCSESGETLSAIGIACFGPLDLNPKSAHYGFITSTPKPGWSGCDVAGEIQRAFDIPVAFDTEVNGAAIGEMTWGATQGLTHFIYLTIGTGIGGGAVIDGKPIHGQIHPEMGHVRIPHDWNVDPFAGVCPYHGDCFEGLANGPALSKRWGQPAETLSSDHPAWHLEAEYISLALQNYILTLSPQRIILGGGVMGQKQLFPLIRERTLRHLNGYVQSPVLLQQIDSYIVPPALGSRAGVLGALAMARKIGGE
ncbi:MAG: ROK family protein [Anaerolineaceae bacterium]|nr:ROK family protein [Anaerolineaceae bacterium]